MDSFLFVTPELEVTNIVFEEGKEVFAKLWGTLMELDKESINGKVYSFEEAESIRKSIEGSPIYYDIDWSGKHMGVDVKTGWGPNPIGIVEKAKIVGKKIKGLIKVTAPFIVEKLKNGAKFLFSIGGKAKAEKIIQKAGRLFSKLVKVVVTHVQLIPDGKNIFGKSKVGFPSAKMEKLVEIQESVLVYPFFEVFCDDVCKVVTPEEEIPILDIVEEIVVEDIKHNL